VAGLELTVAGSAKRQAVGAQCGLRSQHADVPEPEDR
jgi:hypothetical protein